MDVCSLVTIVIICIVVFVSIITLCPGKNQSSTFKYSAEHMNIVNHIARRLKINRNKVLARAMALLEVSIEENKKGNQISITKDGKIIKEITGIL